jgi:hypothetical protein
VQESTGQEMKDEKSLIEKQAEEIKRLRTIIRAGMVESGSPPGEHWHLVTCLANLAQERDEAIKKLEDQDHHQKINQGQACKDLLQKIDDLRSLIDGWGVNP